MNKGTMSHQVNAPRGTACFALFLSYPMPKGLAPLQTEAVPLAGHTDDREQGLLADPQWGKKSLLHQGH